MLLLSAPPPPSPPPPPLHSPQPHTPTPPRHTTRRRSRDRKRADGSGEDSVPEHLAARLRVPSPGRCSTVTRPSHPSRYQDSESPAPGAAPQSPDQVTPSLSRLRVPSPGRCSTVTRPSHPVVITALGAGWSSALQRSGAVESKPTEVDVLEPPVLNRP